MDKKWQVYWDSYPFLVNEGLAGFVELTNQSKENIPQVRFFVLPDLSIKITEVLYDDDNEWQGMPQYIKDQIEREARLMFDAYDEGYKTAWG